MSVLLAPQTSSAAFGSPVSYDVGNGVNPIIFPDLDSDNDIDIVTANYTANNVSVLLNDGNGTFATAVNYAVGSGPTGVVAVDLDGDDDLDLAAANNTSGSVSILLNNGNGTFAAVVNYAVGAGPGPVIAANLDGDSDIDLVTAHYSGNVSVLLNNGNGTFAAVVNYAVGGGPTWVIGANLDGDSDIDLVTANSAANNVSVLVNNGSGAFAAAVNYSVGVEPNTVAAANLDGDSDIDLVTANYTGDNVSVLLNNGNGTFAAVVNYPAGDGAWSISVHDLDTDGDSDIVTANSSGNVSILLNSGNGTFAAAVNYIVGNGINMVAVADFGGDNDLDLAVANNANNNVSILLNNGSGTFVADVNYPAGNAPWAIFPVDLDNDSDMDLAMSNLGNAKVSILLSDLYVPGEGGSDSTMGTVNVVKIVINDNGGTKTVANFPLFVNGTRVFSGVTNAFPAPNNVYVVTETADPNYTRTFSGDCDINGRVVQNPGSNFNRFCIVTNDDIGPPAPVPSVPPLIDVVKVPNPLAMPDGPGPVTYTYTLRNMGTAPVTDVTMVGDTCSPIILMSGDTNDNAILEVNETWLYRCSTTLSETHTNTVVVTGWANGISAVDAASATVVVGIPVVPPLIHLTKVPNRLTLSAGGGIVTYTFTVTNPGTVPLSNVHLADDRCGPTTYISGDTNVDLKLDTTETWTFTCQWNVTTTMTNTAMTTGEANGFTIRDIAITTVVVATDLVNLALLQHPDDLMNLQSQSWWNLFDLPTRQQAYAQILFILGSPQTLANYVSLYWIQNVQSYSWWLTSPYKQQAWNIILQGEAQR